jgi:hypothetical protein
MQLLLYKMMEEIHVTQFLKKSVSLHSSFLTPNVWFSDTSSLILGTLAPCPNSLITLSSCIIYPLYLRSHKLKGSVTQNCPYYRGQMQVWASHTSEWPAMNQGFLWPASWVWSFSRLAHRTQRNTYLLYRKPDRREMSGKVWKRRGGWFFMPSPQSLMRLIKSCWRIFPELPS